MKKYLRVYVTRHDGSVFSNHLKLSEAHFVSQLAQENRSLTVDLHEVPIDKYKYIFGL